MISKPPLWIQMLIGMLIAIPVLITNANAPGAESPTPSETIESCFAPMQATDMSDFFIQSPISHIVGSGSMIPKTSEIAWFSSVSGSGEVSVVKKSKAPAKLVKAVVPKKWTMPSDSVLMKKVCSYGKSHGRMTELCDNWELFGKLKAISEKRGVPFALQLGIALRESHIGTNFKSTDPTKEDYVCAGTHNWAGLKKRVLDSGKGTREVQWADGTTYAASYPDSNGCWLYPFDSTEDFWGSFANTLKYGYISKGLDTPSEIAPRYVGRSDIESSKWVITVSKLYAVE